jgi:hypothetical protein
MFYIGLDLGQENDPTAIAITESMELIRAYQAPVFHSLHLRHLERVPLGTPYPRVVERVREIVQHPELSNNCALAVDGTCVGRPVVDMLRAARLGCDISAVTITGGHTQTQSGAWTNVPKQDLLAVMQLMLERGELRISRNMKYLGALLQELADFRSHPNTRGHLRLGADAYGEHDDLVIALALACWRAKRPKNGFGPGRLPGI